MSAIGVLRTAKDHMESHLKRQIPLVLLRNFKSKFRVHGGLTHTSKGETFGMIRILMFLIVASGRLSCI